jgi:hypothetical protein
MQNLDYSPYVHFKSPLPYDWCMFIEFHPLINIFIQVNNLNDTLPSPLLNPLEGPTM